MKVYYSLFQVCIHVTQSSNRCLDNRRAFAYRADCLKYFPQFRPCRNESPSLFLWGGILYTPYKFHCYSVNTFGDGWCMMGRGEGGCIFPNVLLPSGPRTPEKPRSCYPASRRQSFLEFSRKDRSHSANRVWFGRR